MEPLENQLFTWKEWDGDHECMTYYNPVLKVQIGEFPAGTHFDSATILFDKAILQLANNDAFINGRADILVCGEYNLKLTVGEAIS